MLTFFASPERSSKENITLEVNSISNSTIVAGLLKSVGGLLLVLNDKRQVLAINDKLLEFLGVSSKFDVLGQRLGEMVNCTHSKEQTGGCGTSKYCSTCGAAIAITSSLADKEVVEKSCAIEIDNDGKKDDLYFKVVAQPITYNDSQFVLIFLQDTSAEQKRSVLERTFFHDINNLLSGLIGASDLLEPTADDMGLVDVIKLTSTRLHKEVEIQRTLLGINADNLDANIAPIETHAILKELHSFFVYHPLAEGKSLTIAEPTENTIFTSDISLVIRIITNMITNALEASEIGETVTVDTNTTDLMLSFSVHNSGTIPEDIAKRVFQRNFSTKSSSGRGLGTFSMKLFGETVLGGNVTFTSTASEGTTFTFSLPR